MGEDLEFNRDLNLDQAGNISYSALLQDILYNTGYNYENPTDDQKADVDRVMNLEFNPKWKLAVEMRYSNEGKHKLREIAYRGGSNSVQTARMWLAKGINFIRNNLNPALFPFKE